MLTLSRGQQPRPELIALGDWLRDFAAELRARDGGQSVTWMLAPGTEQLKVRADPRHLHQVLTILCRTASPTAVPGEPAKVTVAVRIAPPRPPAELNVTDRGPGIPEEVRPDLHAVLHHRAHGTGLGLYIAQQLCEANQCTLTYQPVPGGGSCFRIILPPGMTLMQDDVGTGRFNLA